MDFFDKLSQKASDVYKGAADKTNKLARETKLKSKINQDKAVIESLYAEIGKKVYEKHVREENIDIKKELEEECTKIDVLTAEIETYSNEILECKNKKKCSNCFAEIELNTKFCPVCGAKQEEIPENKEENSTNENKKKCIKCSALIDENAKFCQTCGSKQEESSTIENKMEPEKVLEKLEKAPINEENSKEAQMVEEEMEKKIDEENNNN